MDGRKKTINSEKISLSKCKIEICQHIEKFLVPILKKDACNDMAVEELCNKLCKNMLKGGDCGLSTEKRTLSIRQLKQSKTSMEPTLSKNSYRHSKSNGGTCNGIEPTGPVLIGMVHADGGVRNHLYLADASAHVVALMIQPKTEYINAVVLIKEWKYLVPDSDVSIKLPGYVEVTGDVIILLPKQSCTAPPRKFEKIIGIVTLITSILNYGMWDFVMAVRIEEGDKEEMIVVKNKSLIYLSQAITVGCVVCCRSMKQVKMKWDGRLKSMYWLEESGSIEILEHFVEISRLNNTVFKKYMREKLEVCLAEIGLFCGQNIACYIGEITNIISGDFAIYELDRGDVILHTAYQPCVDYGIGRRIGSLIMITYAHQFQAADGKLNLVCCRRTKVTLIKFSNHLQSWKPIRLLGNNFLTGTPKCDFPHPMQLIHVGKFAKSICKSFRFLSELSCRSPDCFDSILGNILTSNLSTVAERGVSKNSGAYNEVFTEPHTCVASQSIMKPVEEYRIISIKQLCNEVFRIGADFHPIQRREYWCHTVLPDSLFSNRQNSKNNSEFILGCIDSNENGKIIIRDYSGMIECFIMMEDSDETDGVKRFPWCTEDIGCLVRIHRFSIVIEKLYDPTVPEESRDFTPNRNYRIAPCQFDTSYHFYIVAHTSDVQVICSHTGDVSVNQLGCADQNNTKENNSDMPPCSNRSCVSKNPTSEKEFVNLLVCVCQPPTAFNQYLLKGYLGESSGEDPRSVTFDLKNMKKWTPFIRTGIFLKISIPGVKEKHSIIVLDDDCSISHHHVKDHPLLQRIPTEKVWPFQEVIDQRRSLPIRGKIISRHGHLDCNTHRQRLCFASFDKCGRSAELCIYLGKTTGLSLPNGLIPGCTAVITPGKICLSERGNVYCKSCRSINVEWTPTGTRTRTAPSTSIQSEQHDEGGSWESSMPANLLISHQSSDCPSTSQPTVINVFPVKVVFVKISALATDSSRDQINFYAKCTVSDHTATSDLHFYSNSYHQFFKFIGVEDVALQHFLESILEQNELVYNVRLHNSENTVPKELTGQECRDLRVLILMCNNANICALPSKRCLVRRNTQGSRNPKLNHQTLEGSTGKENSVYVDDYHQRLHFDCIRFLE